MRPSTISAAILALLSQTACELEPEATPEPLRTDAPRRTPGATTLHAAIGGPIDAATADRWIENRRQTDADEIPPSTLEATQLRKILAAPGCVGIALHYGTDDADRVHIVPIGMDSAGREIDDAALPAEARRLVGQYTGPVRYHFFGRNTFVRLLDEARSEAVRVTPALDDDDNPQLLLSDAADQHPRVYEDRSAPPTL